MEIRCSQCGASQVVAADVRLLQCEFCDTALVVDGRGTLFREVLRPTVDATDSAAHMRRFMAGTKTVAGLAKTKFRGIRRVAHQFTFAMAAYNLIRLPRLLAEAA